jgi:hypothetical protein
MQDVTLMRILRRAAQGPAYVQRLRELGQQREAALSQADQALGAICRLVPDAQAAGLPITEIARCAGVSHQTLYARSNAARSPTPAHRPDRHTASRLANPREADAHDSAAG